MTQTKISVKMQVVGSVVLLSVLVQGGLCFDSSLYLSSISNCTCDLSPDKCDTFCCCDQDCDLTALASFNHSCSSVEQVYHYQHNCSRNTSLYDSPLHSLLCIQLSNTAFLGSFHKTAADVESVYIYDQLDTTRTHNYQVSYEQESGAENMTGHYKVGVPIQTIYDREEGVLGTLSLPTNSLKGGCVPDTVRFLRPHSSVCDHMISEDVCQSAKNSYLDHQMYIMSSSVLAQEPNFAQVLAENNQLRTADTVTNYYITNNVQFYLNMDNERESQGDAGPENFNSLKTSLTRRRSKSGLFHNSDYSVYNTVHSVAHFDPQTLSCNNLVLEVHYTIFWAATKIEKVSDSVDKITLFELNSL